MVRLAETGRGEPVRFNVQPSGTCHREARKSSAQGANAVNQSSQQTYNSSRALPLSHSGGWSLRSKTARAAA
jgi:hypothetical protein